jgi:hypothetical protein
LDDPTTTNHRHKEAHPSLAAWTVRVCGVFANRKWLAKKNYISNFAVRQTKRS